MSLQVLHPITIHFPIVLPFLLASLTAFGLYKNGTKLPHLYLVSWLTSLLLFLSSVLAYWSGQRDSFGSAADPDAIAQHALAGKYFLIASAICIFLFGWAWFKKSQSFWYRLFLLFASLVLVGLTIWTSHLGGSLVYQ